MRRAALRRGELARLGLCVAAGVVLSACEDAGTGSVTLPPARAPTPSAGSAQPDASDANDETCGPRPGDAIRPDFTDGRWVELCNGWDEDCDGRIDEGFDRDGDGLSTCARANARPPDCDDGDERIGPDLTERCDGLDNDCDGRWEEGTDGECPAPRCSSRMACPGTLACIHPREPCVEPQACASTTLSETSCEPPEERSPPAECDPSRCGRFTDGTCVGECLCAVDSRYRWRVLCTE